MGADARGDPAAAVLEVLDAECHAKFRDHYLDVGFDLSEVFFLVTANLLDTTPPALRDRLEILRIGGYTREEKIAIARRHLLPRAISESGLGLVAPLSLEQGDSIRLRILPPGRTEGVDVSAIVWNDQQARVAKPRPDLRLLGCVVSDPPE